MPKGVQNPIVVLRKGEGLRVYLRDETGPSIHINADGKVWRDEAGMKQNGTYLTNIAPKP